MSGRRFEICARKCGTHSTASKPMYLDTSGAQKIVRCQVNLQTARDHDVGSYSVKHHFPSPIVSWIEDLSSFGDVSFSPDPEYVDEQSRSSVGQSSTSNNLHDMQMTSRSHTQRIRCDYGCAALHVLDHSPRAELEVPPAAVPSGHRCVASPLRHATSQPLAFSQSGRYGRAALRSCSLPTSSPSSSRLACAAVGHGGWRLAAAVEPQAVQEEEEEQARTEGSGEAGAVGTAEASSKLVLVVGGTGGVGQLVVASLLSRNIKSRLLLRNPEKAVPLFGKQDESLLQVYKADTRSTDDLDPEMFEGVTHVICCTGTTAFPSKRWDGDNTPERVDWDGIRNLVSAMPQTIKRLVLVSSVGVTKCNELPWSIMNLFGVLKYKKMGEDFVRNSGIPFTIIRPGRLTDGPYTSYDLNTLLKATAGERRAVVIGQGDKLVGEASRLVVAEACIQALDIESTEGQIYEINSVKGEGPGSDPEKWKELFRAVQSN